METLVSFFCGRAMVEMLAMKMNIMKNVVIYDGMRETHSFVVRPLLAVPKVKKKKIIEDVLAFFIHIFLVK